MASRKIAVTLPEPLYEAVETARKHEHRSRSDLIQEAVRAYLEVPKYHPSQEELRKIDQALAELDENPTEGVDWEDFREEFMRV